MSATTDVEVEGWLSTGQAVTLRDAAATCPAGGVIVEIGSYRGRSTIELAGSAPPGVLVVAVDPHAGNDRGPQEIDGYADEAELDHEAFHRNLAAAGVSDGVRHVRRFSDEAHDEVDGRIDLLFIDGAHRYGPALSDVRGWGARVRDGGTMLIHDSFSSVGVTAAIVRTLFVGGRFRYVGRSRSLAIYRADLAAGTTARVTNLTRQAAQLPWFLRNITLKVALSVGLGRVWELAGQQRPEWPY